MMEKFRNLSHNIFFKIFLGFLGLAFVIFSISGFLLNNDGSWVAKIGGTKISQQQFAQIAKGDRELIYRSNPGQETLKYLEGDQFKSDVLSRIVTKYLIKALQEDFGVYASTDLILKQISEDPNLKGKDGKFDRDNFRNLLSKNNLTEEKYIEGVKDEIVGTMIVRSFIEASSANNMIAKELYKDREEKRIADVITISVKNVGDVKGPNNFELNGFFEKNKAVFTLPEMRKVHYLVADKKDLLGKISISEEEVKNEYDNNNSLYQKAETRDFYHLLFSDKEKADSFLKALKSAKSQDGDSSQAFAKLALENEKKDKKSISLQKISGKDLFKEISSEAFALQKNQYSQALKSPLGYHVFYLININPASKIALSEVSSKIKSDLLAKKEEVTLKAKLNNIEDEILSSNSLEKVATKFNLKLNKDLPKFNSKGLDSKQNPIPEIKNLDQFIENSLKAKKQETTKLFYSKTGDKYYSIFVDNIDEGRQRSLDEVKVLVTDLWIKDKKQQELQKFAENIAKQIKQNKGDAEIVAKNNNLKIEKNREFPMAYMIDVGGGRKVPYTNKFMEEIFSLKINEVSSPFRVSNEEFAVGVLKNIKVPVTDSKKIESFERGLSEEFKSDILAEYNKYIQTKFPVQINQKLLQGK